jgi:hypothetical protein
MLLRYWQWAEAYYRDEDGNPMRELDNLKDALRPLRQLYPHKLAGEFRPMDLRAVQEHIRDCADRSSPAHFLKTTRGLYCDTTTSGPSG